ncbi:MAG: AAA family ATPase [Pseudonocardiaceae bacterium]
MTTPVLDLDGHVVGRRHELARLDGVLETAGRRGGECVLLSGVPGVGKSTLMQEFGGGVSRRNGVFAYGRHQEGARAPYSALSEALGALVRTMEATGAGERGRWRADLDRGMSSIAGALGTLVPGLGAGAAPELADLDAADGRHRLQRAVTRLVSITASYRPVVLAIDDLQWADQDSLLLLSDLLAASIRNVVLLGAYRTGQFDPSSMDLSSASLCTIDLAPLSTAQLEVLLTEVCGRTVELKDVAAEFHHRTGGNPLQIRQLLRRAQREGALTQLSASGRPAWDLHALTSIEITANVADFLGRAIDQLRPADSAVLSALACLGHEFDLADAADAAAQPAVVVAQALWSALDLRLLEAVDRRGRRIAQVINRETRYRFSHDRVAEAARARLPDEAQRQVHLRIGRRLVELGEDQLFEAARHLGIGGIGGLRMEGDERTRFAEVAQRAAQLARRQASFPLALECCRTGLALLGERRWSAHPALARELQLGAAEAAYLVSDIALLEVLLDEAEQVLPEPADRARLAFLRLKGQVTQYRLQEALETGLQALDELGESLPRRPGKPQVAGALMRMRLTMRGWNDERLLQLPRCADRRIIEIQLILEGLRDISYHVRPELFPFVVRKKLELTLTHGLVPSSPVVIATYGVLLVMRGDHAGSQRFGEVGLLLADRPEFRDARPQTLFLYLNFIRHWRHPIREGLPQLRDAVQEALDRGDHEYAGFLAAVLLYQSFWVGRPLAEIDALAQSLIPEIRSQHTPSSLCRSTQQLCLNLMGRCDDPFLLAGESGYDERVVLPVARRQHDAVLLGVAAITKLGLHFWCGDDAGVLPFAEQTARHLGGLTGTPNVQLFHLTNALSRIRVAPDDRSTARAVRRSLALHRTWAAAAPANYAAPCALVEGVWARARGDLRQAERHLDLAIALAEEHRLPQLSALAHEEAGALHAQTGRVSLSELMVRKAHQRWLSLGMAVRSDRLEQTHPWLLSRDLLQLGSATVDPIGIHRLIQAAPTSDRLAEVLLHSVADTTGAARVLLLMGEGEHLVVRAVREAGITTMVDEASVDVAYHRSIVRDVVRSGRPLIVTAGPGGDHPQRGAAVSVTLAVPVRVRDRVIGAVYAEQHEPVRAFGPGHEEAVVALCAQAAAPLRNFELEGRLQAADEHRESLMDVQSRFIPSELLRILDIDDIRRVRYGHRVERRMTVLISDIRGYTALLEGMSTSEASDVAMGFLRAVEVPIITCNGLLQDVRGDEVLAVFDAEPDDAVRAGLAMLRSLREHNRERVARGSHELRVGIGINTGVVGLGLIGGVNRMALTVIGDAVNLASRVESITKRYGSHLLISAETYAQLVDGDQFDIRRMERVMVVNRRRPVTVYEVYDEDPEPVRAAKRAAQPAFDEAFAWFDAGDAEQARTAFERCRTLLPDDHVAPLHLTHCDALARGDIAPGQEVALLQK